MENFSLEIIEQKKEFDVFLKIPNNDRIILSGIFCIGKSYFLENFFKNSEEYVALYLYPTNYSVASNEDIFELIKIDILYALLEKNVPLEKLDISPFVAALFLDAKDQSFTTQRTYQRRR